MSGEVDVHLISISEPASPVRMVPGLEGRGVYVGVHHPTSLDATVGLAVNNFFHFDLLFGRKLWTGFKKTGLSPHKNLDVCEVGRREVQYLRNHLGGGWINGSHRILPTA